MKKIVLLLTLLCGALNGMEEPGHYAGMEELSPEVKVMIIQALHTYDNLEDIIYAIKATSLTNSELNEIVNDMYGNMKGFEKLVEILAKKFPNRSKIAIAKIFGTQKTEQYIQDKPEELKNYLTSGMKLIAMIAYEQGTLEDITNLINKGADVNFYAPEGTNVEKLKGKKTPLILAVFHDNGTDIIQLLLDSGANPFFKDTSGKTALDHAKEGIKNFTEWHMDAKRINTLKHIQEILENAMQ